MKIIGTIDTIIYKNEENNYYILLVDTQEDMVTITGVFSDVVEEMTYEFFVTQQQHPVYGLQYRADAYKIKLPTESDRIEHFLASGLFEGIGTTMATRIVAAFGEQTLEVMRYQPTKLKELHGIGDATLDKIVNSFQRHLEAEEVLFYLNGLGLSAKQSFKIYEGYGSKTIAKIEENPYCVLREIKGLGFKSVDAMAAKMGIAKNSQQRQEALVLYILERETINGHMYLYFNEILHALQNLARISEDQLREVLEALTISGEVALDNSAEQLRVYTRAMYDTELGIVREIARVHSAPLSDISYASNLSDLELTEEQQWVVDRGFDSAIYILTGGPGTGKTTILKEWVYRIEAAGLKCALCAPTGRAASRIEEVVGRPASTIHRLLEYKYQEDTQFLLFHRNRDNPLEGDVIIVDEVSMMDAPLFLKLLQAVGSGSRLMLIGDANQLPAVGPGNVLADLIASGAIAKGQLTKIHRQAADSLILSNAHAMLNQGEIIINQKARDFFFIQAQGQRQIQQLLLDVVKHRLPQYYQINPIEDITVLTALKAGQLGAIGVNETLQAALNSAEGTRIFGRFLVGDKVMQNRNNYGINWIKQGSLEEGEGVFNGEVGRVDHVGQKGMYVLFGDGKMACYTREIADDLMLAYAMTIHKSQGNEFDYVVIPIYSLPEVIKSKNLIYTAITRAKKQITLIGSPLVFNELIHTTKLVTRNATLAERLKHVEAGV